MKKTSLAGAPYGPEVPGYARLNELAQGTGPKTPVRKTRSQKKPKSQGDEKPG